MRKTLTAALFAGFAAVIATSSAFAQDYPKAGAIRIVVPFAPGAGNDLLGRMTADYLTQRLGQNVIVENKAGAGSAIGVDYVAKSKPDGYTLLWSASDGITILPAAKSNVPYRVPDDFTYLARIVQMPFMMAVNPKLPIKSMAELIAYAKAHPGELRYGTTGVGGAPHMGTVMLEKGTGIELLHVPFGGMSLVVNALLSETIDIALITPTTVKPHVDAGKFRVIASTGTERHSLFPNTPTLGEEGIKDVVVTVWYGMLAPAGVPEPILERLRREIGDMLKDPKIVTRLDTSGYQISFLPGNEFRDYIISDLAQWKKVAQSANIKLDE